MTYLEYKSDFIRKNGGLEKVETSSMNQYGEYTKWYFLSNGNIMVEENMPAWRTVEITETLNGEVIGKREEKIKCMRTEVYSNTTNSIIFYEKW